VAIRAVLLPFFFAFMAIVAVHFGFGECPGHAIQVCPVTLQAVFNLVVGVRSMHARACVAVGVVLLHFGRIHARTPVGIGVLAFFSAVALGVVAIEPAVPVVVRAVGALIGHVPLDVGVVDQ
jgi:hypothetical protein